MHLVPMSPFPRAHRALVWSLSCAALVLGLGGCPSSGGDEPPEPEPEPESCTSATYLPFDAEALAAFSAKVQAQSVMAEQADLAEREPATAASAFEEIEKAYGPLAESVKAARDVRLSAAPLVGTEIDAQIVAALARGKAATTPIAVTLAWLEIDYALLRAFSLLAFEQMSTATQAGYDSGFAHLGYVADNDVGQRSSVARLASDVDAMYDTAWADLLYGALKDGRCELEKGLGAGTASDLEQLQDFRSVYEKVLMLVSKTFATGLAGAAAEVPAGSEETARLRLAGAEGCFAVLQPLMAADSAMAQDATYVQTQLTNAREAIAGGSTNWMASFPGAEIRSRMNKAFALGLR